MVLMTPRPRVRFPQGANGSCLADSLPQKTKAFGRSRKARPTTTCGSSIGRASDCSWLSRQQFSEGHWFDSGPQETIPYRLEV